MATSGQSICDHNKHIAISNEPLFCSKFSIFRAKRFYDKTQDRTKIKLSAKYKILVAYKAAMPSSHYRMWLTTTFKTLTFLTKNILQDRKNIILNRFTDKVPKLKVLQKSSFIHIVFFHYPLQAMCCLLDDMKITISVCRLGVMVFQSNMGFLTPWALLAF